MPFDHDKKQILSRRDKSKKGDIDPEIRPLVDLINSMDNFYTTSSCSGRIMLLSAGEKKWDCDWLYVTHDKADTANILENLSSNASVTFKIESPIIHVCARTTEDAAKMLRIANECGFRRAGAITLSKKIILEIIGPENLNVPLRKQLVSDDYIDYLTKTANLLLKKARKRMEKFYIGLKSLN